MKGARLWVCENSGGKSLGEAGIQVQVFIGDEVVDLAGDSGDIVDLSPVQLANKGSASAHGSPRQTDKGGGKGKEACSLAPAANLLESNKMRVRDDRSN